MINWNIGDYAVVILRIAFLIYRGIMDFLHTPFSRAVRSVKPNNKSDYKTWPPMNTSVFAFKYSIREVRDMKKIIVLKGSFTIQHLLPCTDGYMMVEAGGEKDFSSFLSKLSKHNVDPGEIRYLFLTHHHEDHAGFTASLQKLSGCRIIAHREAVRFLEKGKHADTGGGVINGRTILLGLYLYLKGVRLNFTPVTFREEDYIVDGDDNEILRNLGVPGKILYTPGHSPDSISLLLDNGLCFCGDAAMGKIKWLGNRYCCIYISDVNEYYRSWEKMIQEGATTIYPAHGSIFPSDKLEQNLDHFKQEKLLFAKK